MAHKILIFNHNTRHQDEKHPQEQANDWLKEHSTAKVVSVDYWEGFPPGWDDYHQKVTLVVEEEV